MASWVSAVRTHQTPRTATIQACASGSSHQATPASTPRTIAPSHADVRDGTRPSSGCSTGEGCSECPWRQPVPPGDVLMGHSAGSATSAALWTRVGPLAIPPGALRRAWNRCYSLIRAGTSLPASVSSSTSWSCSSCAWCAAASSSAARGLGDVVAVEPARPRCPATLAAQSGSGDAVLVGGRRRLERGDVLLRQDHRLLGVGDRRVDLDELAVRQPQDLTALPAVQQQLAVAALQAEAEAARRQERRAAAATNTAMRVNQVSWLIERLNATAMMSLAPLIDEDPVERDRHDADARCASARCAGGRGCGARACRP